MVTGAEIDKLRAWHATGPSVLSLYLAVSKDPALRRGLPARAEELYALAAWWDGPHQVVVSGPDRQAVRLLLEQRAGDWLGHTVAIFASAELRLLEAIPLPGPLPDRAVLATAPHVRPLLVAAQRSPGYRVVVVDRQHAWLLRVTGESIETTGRADVPAAAARSVRSQGFGGWYGLAAYRTGERIVQLARHHYHDTAAMLEQATRASGPQPLAVGGHEQSIGQFLTLLPASVRRQVAGTFVTDPHTLTPAHVRTLAAPVIGRWVHSREERLVASLLTEPPGPLTAAGLPACLTAVSQHAVALLVVPVGGLIPGMRCQGCGALGAVAGDCRDGPASWHPVPDLIEEMVVRTLDDGGQVQAVTDPPAGLTARLRFPLAAAEGAETG